MKYNITPLKWLKRKLLQQVTVEVKREETLYEAELAFFEHQAAAEHHQALANMYDARIKRLKHRPHVAEAPRISTLAR